MVEICLDILLEDSLEYFALRVMSLSSIEIKMAIMICQCKWLSKISL